MSRAAAAPAPAAALVLKLWPNPFHHGALGIVRSLGRAGVSVYATVESGGSPAGWSRYLSGRFLWTPDLADVPGVVDALIGLGRAIGGRPVLIPTDDAGAIVSAEHAEALAPWFRLPPQPAGLPRRLAAKDGLAGICRELGIPTAGTRRFGSPGELLDVAEELGYPAVVKLATPWETPGGRLRSTTVVRDAGQLRALADGADPGSGPPVLLQEYLPAEHCEDWFFHGCVGEHPDGTPAFRLSVTGRKIRSYPPAAGLTSLGRAWDNPELRASAEDFLTAVGYRGIVDLDYRLDRRTGRYHLLDANPRVGAQFAVARRADGEDAAWALYRELTGRPLPPQAAQSRDHALWVENYDLASAAWQLVTRRFSPRDWWRSMRAGPVEPAWYAADDLLPWLVMWLRFARRLLTLRRPGRPGRFPHPVPRRAVRLRSRRLPGRSPGPSRPDGAGRGPTTPHPGQSAA